MSGTLNLGAPPLRMTIHLGPGRPQTRTLRARDEGAPFQYVPVLELGSGPDLVSHVAVLSPDSRLATWPLTVEEVDQAVELRRARIWHGDDLIAVGAVLAHG